MFKVVVVEDEELLRMGLTNFFDWNAYGFELAGEAGNGQKGLEVIRQVRPDLVITDIKMPHMDGIEMTEILTSEMPDLEIVIISGYDDFAYARRAIKAGVSEYILKPIKMDNLKEAIFGIQKKLEKKASDRAQIESLKASHEKSRRAERESLFTDLLLKEKKPAGWMEEDESLSQAIFLVALVSLRNFSVRYMDCDYQTLMERDQVLEQQVERCLEESLGPEERESVCVLRSTYGERILCCMGKGYGGLEKISEALKHAFGGDYPETQQMEVFFGSTSEGLEGLKASYEKARKRSEESFLHQWQEATGNATGQEESLLDYDLTDLCVEIRTGDEKSMHEAMRAFREALAREKVSSYLEVVLVVSSAYRRLSQLPQEAGGSLSEVIGDGRKYYQRMIGKMKREEMLDELEAFCLKLQTYIQELTSDRKQEIMRRTEEYIRKNFSKVDLSMKETAEAVYVSVSYLGMIIKRETGKTFTEYLTEVRVSRAKQLLKETGMKNYEIAEACGYATPAYFSTVFKGSVGMTPSEYRSKANE